MTKYIYDETKNYNASAAAKSQEAADLSRRINRLTLVEAIVLVLLAIFDVTLFFAPFSEVDYSASPLDIGIKVLVCAIAPIALAASTAHAITQVKRSASANDGILKWALPVFLAILTVIALAVGCYLRNNYYADETGVGLMLNVAAVLLAVFAFAIDLVVTRKTQIRKARRDEALIECNALGALDHLSLYRHASEMDESRRAADDTDYNSLNEQVIQTGIDLAGLARHVIAKEVATSPEERDHILGTPLQVGREIIDGETRAEVFEQTRKAVGAPSASDISNSWEMPSINTPSFDYEQILEYERRQAHLNRIRGVEEEASQKPSLDKEPIPVHAEFVYEG